MLYNSIFVLPFVFRLSPSLNFVNLCAPQNDDRKTGDGNALADAMVGVLC